VPKTRCLRLSLRFARAKGDTGSGTNAIKSLSALYREVLISQEFRFDHQRSDCGFGDSRLLQC